MEKKDKEELIALFKKANIVLSVLALLFIIALIVNLILKI